MKIDDTLILNAAPSSSKDYGPEQYIIHLGINSYSYLIYGDEYAYAVYDIPSGTYHSFWYNDGWRMMEDGIRLQIKPGYKPDTQSGPSATATISKSGTDLVLTVTGRNGWTSREDTLEVPLKFTII